MSRENNHQTSKQRLTLESLPRYIAVEGPIGVGKTSFTRRLAETLNYETILETPEANPFLERFYQNRRQAALQTQLFFLFERARQIQELRQSDMFEPVRVADFILEKDRLFAEINLDSDELKLYDNIYDHLTIEAPTPDLVVYLQAPADVLLDRVQQRGMIAEQDIEKSYLTQLVEAYTEFFHYYEAAPLLIVNAAEIDLVNNDQDYESLLKYLLSVTGGRHYYNPTPSMI
ncbi:MAG: deoxynucleoside kinase [bacterium]|nr:deoxynucleoside kinase [Gammaproteobacteria bacterium]HIL97743.1 deoxynucleoside kinase [Pseudomonadales bacterium]